MSCFCSWEKKKPLKFLTCWSSPGKFPYFQCKTKRASYKVVSGGSCWIMSMEISPATQAVFTVKLLPWKCHSVPHLLVCHLSTARAWLEIARFQCFCKLHVFHFSRWRLLLKGFLARLCRKHPSYEKLSLAGMLNSSGCCLGSEKLPVVDWASASMEIIKIASFLPFNSECSYSGYLWKYLMCWKSPSAFLTSWLLSTDRSIGSLCAALLGKAVLVLPWVPTYPNDPWGSSCNPREVPQGHLFTVEILDLVNSCPSRLASLASTDHSDLFVNICKKRKGVPLLLASICLLGLLLIRKRMM